MTIQTLSAVAEPEGTYDNEVANLAASDAMVSTDKNGGPNAKGFESVGDDSYKNSSGNNSNNSNNNHDNNSKSQSGSSNSRSELENLIREFQNKLGTDWEKYHETVSLFLIGKLSRPELVRILNPILKDDLYQYHNKLLLLNFANSLTDTPVEFGHEFASFWNKKSSKSNKVKSSQYEKFKQNIMSLSIKERRRIKNITRESGKQGKLNAGITLTRHSLLPKIPMIQDKEQQQLQVNNLVQWQQDVVSGINTPICTENYELPDSDNLTRRTLMTMREYGLTGGVDNQVLEVLLLGLEAHLKNIMEKAIDVTKYRENKYTNNDYMPPIESLNPKENKSQPFLSNGNSNKRKFDEIEPAKDITLHVEDFYDTFEMFPHLIEPYGAKYRLPNVMLDSTDMDPQTLDYQLPPKAFALTIEDSDKVNGSIEKKEEKPIRPDAHIGTTDELKWVLHDLVTTM